MRLSEQIDALKYQGYDVRIQHVRNENENGEVLPKGGSTLAFISYPRTDWVLVGIAECSDQDNYNKRLGAQIALGRASKELMT